MKAPIRLSAIMELPVIYIFTHDSIGVGEDGPTHQPIEQLVPLRAIPGMIVLRPADANEVAEAWRVVMQQHDRPACLILSRQALPTIDRSKFASAAGRGQGRLHRGRLRGQPDVILIGTGSEVALCMGAYETLTAEGIKARVVSMPSWELFEDQDEAYRDEVLPPDVQGRVAVEQAATIGWDRYVGQQAPMIGMHTFGASAPLPDLQKKFGFTPEAVLERRPQASEPQVGDRAMNDMPPGYANPLKALEQLGQSPWLDFIERKFLADGLADADRPRRVEGDDLQPVDLREGDGPRHELRRRVQGIGCQGRPGRAEHLRDLAIQDIQQAADLLLPVYEATNKLDGYVSLEVSPYLALRTDDTIAEARRLWKLVGPAQPDGEGARHRRRHAGHPTLIGEGMNINVTLLFSAAGL